MKDYVVIDLEMTGLNAKKDVILEVGAVRVRNHQITDSLQFLVNPNRSLERVIVELTGITQEMADSGVSQQEALRRVVDFVGEDVLVGHNLIFDYSFLKQLAVNERISFEKKAIDTLKLSRRFLAVPESKSLDSLCDYYGFVREENHRALEDVRATQELFEMLQRDYKEENPQEFEPKQLQYRPKRETPATPAQKKHLKELLDYHKIDVDITFETMTRSEASRKIDQILTQYGRVPKASVQSYPVGVR